MKKLVWVGSTLLAVGMSSAVFAAPVLINGAGATFPNPLYSRWVVDFKDKVDHDAQINYQSIGSGGGIKQFTEKTVDFGATDSPMKDEDIAKVEGGVYHIPTVMGAVVVSYNLKGIEKGLKLTGEMVADIYLGKINKWNDPRIVELNKDLKLPDTAILVTHRSDGSGTTGIFTDYLAKVSPTWGDKRKGNAIEWPLGLGGKGNEGVAGLIKGTEGSIGYVELIYAEQNKLAYAAVKNRTGQFVMPTLKSVTASAAGALKAMPEDFRISLTNADGKESYPISGFTYLLVHPKMSGDKGKKIVKFLTWALSDGQKSAEPLNYAPLPRELVTKVAAKVKTIQLAE